MRNKILRSFYTLLFIWLSFSCSFISSFTGEATVDTTLSLDKQTLTLDIGAMDIITLKSASNQNKAAISWEYDSSIISCKTDNYGAVITALDAGSTYLKARYGGSEISCKVTVNPTIYSAVVANPYVYSSTDYVTITPGTTQKITASLYGGTPSDINGFKFSIDNSSVAMISNEGNYCWITGSDVGCARLTISHNKSSYSYSVLVNCTYDSSATTYITTDNNIVTLDTSEGTSTKSISFNLMNPPATSYESLFQMSLCDSEGNELDNFSAPVSIVNQIGGTVELQSTKNSGECYLKVTHPNASYNYDLKVLIRVVSNADVSYVDFELPDSLLILSGSESKEVSASLKNYSGDIDYSKMQWIFPSDVNKYIEYETLNGNLKGTGNFLRVKGKKTGNVKVTVNYPGCESKTFAIIIRDIENEAAAVSTYITTTQNYIKLTTEDEPVQININVFNITEEEAYDLDWHFNSITDDGSSDKVVECHTSYGNVRYSSSRSMASVTSSSSASCTIEPLRPGKATVSITHPKAIYPTIINIVVTEPIQEIPVSYLSLVSNPIIKLKYGSGTSYNIDFKGNEPSKIKWEHQADSANTCLIQNNGTSPTSVYISSNGFESQYDENGNDISVLHDVTINTILVTHPDCTTPIPITVYCYDDESQLSDLVIPSMWSNSTYSEIGINQSVTLELFTENINDSEIRWDCPKELSCTNSGNKSILNITGLTPGLYTLSASAKGITLFFNVKVYNAKIIDETKPVYLSTTDNVVYFNDVNTTKEIGITLNNVSEEAYSQIKWEVSNTALYEIGGGKESFGSTASITSLANPCESTITVSHPLAENTLTIHLRTGNEFVFVNSEVGYISTQEDTLTLFTGDNPYKLYAVVNYSESSNQINSGFKFSIDDNSIASVNYYSSLNYCEIKPLKNGITTLTIENSIDPTAIPKEVIIIVERGKNDKNYPFIKTNQNVVTVLEGDFTSITCDLVNTTSYSSSDWNWKSENPLIADVIGTNGSVGMISANKPGTVKIKVSNTKCTYSIDIIVIVIDSKIAQTNPFISVSDSIIHLKKGESKQITSRMIGGDNPASVYFTSSVSSSVVSVDQRQDSTYIRAMSSGISNIVIKNSLYPNAYAKSVLVVVEDESTPGVFIKPSVNVLKIKPDNKSLQTITATLENGEELDSQNFIWWADDYNMVQISTVTNTCSVTPLGISGTTKIHISHPKAANSVEIIVLISEYDTFAFSQSSFQAYTNQIHFVPMQVPAMEGECTIEYSTDDKDICVIQGSKEVAWVCGVSTGYTTLHAKLLNANKTVIATARMFVNVTVVDPKLPFISTSDVIYNINAGESAELNAILNGDNINDQNYRLIWEIDSSACESDRDGKYINFRNYGSNSGNYFIGNSCVIETKTANPINPTNRHYIIKVFYYEDTFDYTKDDKNHSNAISTANILFVVNETGEVTIDLSTYYEDIYMDDGGFKIIAKLNNGSSADLKNIEWSAIKSGGANIVNVSKSGEQCSVIPRTPGTTYVIARLPTGATAQCTVIVRNSATLSFYAEEVWTIPGYTVEIPFTKTPATAPLGHLVSYSSTTSGFDSSGMKEWFSYSFDEVNGILSITGKEEYNDGMAGKITAYIANSSGGGANSNKKEIKVYCQYKPELYLYSYNSNFLNKPEDTELIKLDSIQNTDYDSTTGKYGTKQLSEQSFIVKYFPSDMELSLDFDTDICELSRMNTSQYIDKDGKAYAIISLAPKKEGYTDVKVTAKLPNASDKTITEKFSYEALYSDEYIKNHTSIIPITSSGQFSKTKHRSNNNSLIGIELSDGESIGFTVEVSDPMIDMNSIEMAYVPNNNSSNINTKPFNKSNILTSLSINDNSVTSSTLNSLYSPDLTKFKTDKSIITDKYKLKSYKGSSIYIPCDYSENRGYNSDLNGMIYVQKNNLGDKTLFTLGHGFDFYKRLPNFEELNIDSNYGNGNTQLQTEHEERVKKYGADPVSKDYFTFVQGKANDSECPKDYYPVDTFLVTKDMIFKDSKKNEYYTVKHTNTSYFPEKPYKKSNWKIENIDGVDVSYTQDACSYLNYGFASYLYVNNELINTLNWLTTFIETEVKYDKYFYYKNSTPYTITANEVQTNYINTALESLDSIKDAPDYYYRKETYWEYNEETGYEEHTRNIKTPPFYNKNILATIMHHKRYLALGFGVDDEKYIVTFQELKITPNAPVMFHKYLSPTVTKDTTKVKTFNNIGSSYFVIFHNNKKTIIGNVDVTLNVRNCQAYQSGLWEAEGNLNNKEEVHWISKVETN